MRSTAILFVLTVLLLAPPLRAVEPETCLTTSSAAGSVTAEFGGKVYHLASSECREMFLSDPERYAQLFDALAELGPEAPRPLPDDRVSLVPN